jgi:ribosomal protein S18 acetylase RimI-like enzyme
MVVRRANIGDTAVLLPLVEQYWEFEGLTGFDAAALRAALERLLSSPTIGAIWMATDAQRPLGYLAVVYVFSLEHRGVTAEIDEFFVLPGHRTCGVGSQLLCQAEVESARQGCTNISLQVSTSNRRAKEFYVRQGYSHRSGFQLLEKSLGAV